MIERDRRPKRVQVVSRYFEKILPMVALCMVYDCDLNKNLAQGLEDLAQGLVPQAMA